MDCSSMINRRCSCFAGSPIPVQREVLQPGTSRLPWRFCWKREALLSSFFMGALPNSLYSWRWTHSLSLNCFDLRCQLLTSAFLVGSWVCTHPALPGRSPQSQLAFNQAQFPGWWWCVCVCDHLLNNMLVQPHEIRYLEPSQNVMW